MTPDSYKGITPSVSVISHQQYKGKENILQYQTNNYHISKGVKILSLWDMKTFGKRIRTNEVKVKLFSSDNNARLEEEINDWLKSVDYEIVSIEFSTDNSYKRVLILYKI